MLIPLLFHYLTSTSFKELLVYFCCCCCFFTFSAFFPHVPLSAGYGCRSLRFGQPDNGFALQGHLLRNITLKMGNELSGDCRYECLMESNCVSVNVGPPDKNGLRVCQLSDSDHIQHPEHLTAQEGFLYWATQVK